MTSVSKWVKLTFGKMSNLPKLTQSTSVGQRLESDFQDPKPTAVSLIRGQSRRSWGCEEGLQPDVNLPIPGQGE